MTDDLYERWIQHLFDRPDAEPEWYWDDTACEFEASDEQKVILIGKTFSRSGTDLKMYNDTQVRNGLSYILNGMVSDVSYLLTGDGVAEGLRIETVVRMKHLYRDCFVQRCSQGLGHLSEPVRSPLDTFCYMLWDVSPLGQWKDVVLDVMEDALYLPHDACIESALHGLGHYYFKDKARVPEIIGHFLAKEKGLRSELRAYAMRAATGMVQ